MKISKGHWNPRIDCLEILQIIGFLGNKKW